MATGYGLGLVALPIPALPGSPAVRDVVTVVVAVLVAVATAASYARSAATGRNRWLGAVLVVLACLLYSVTPAGVSTAVLALLVGAGAGLLGGRPWPGPAGAVAVGTALGVVVVLGSWAIGGTGSALPYEVGGVTAVVAAALLLLPAVVRGTPAEAPAGGGPAAGRPGVRRTLLTVAVVGGAGLFVWTGCNDPQVSWFGPVVWHGPRDRPQVAITFDDGPNATATLEIARLLDERSAKGTFFLVGTAVEERPDVVRRLVEDGHLVGNHSWRHDYWGWLDPRYPELGETQAVIAEEAGVCPRFFRPPHGQRTPFMNLQIASRDMVTATWDVSAADWITDDGGLVARRVLDRVRPGSIVLLHDSIDGRVDADRQVILDALPIILDGLARKGLEAVRLDELVGGPAYLPLDDC